MTRMSLESKILIGVMLALIALFATLLVMNADLRADLARAETGNAGLRLANDEFKEAAQKQMQAAEQLRIADALRAKRAETAQKAAAGKIARFEAEAGQLAKIKPEGSDCAAAGRLIDAYVRRGQ
jgi:hypothetical protein